jgi:hypothetical protein
MIDLARAAACLACLTGVLSLATSASAQEAQPTAEQAQPTRDQCLEAHRNAQQLKQSSRFLEAQEHLQVCSSASCPGAIISDCGDWITELERVTPSLVFEVRVDGKVSSSATVSIDGQVVTDRAHAFKVNPGQHVVRVEVPSFEPREEQVVVPEGQRMRLLSYDFDSKPVEATAPPPPPPAAPPPPPERPTPFIVYPLLGLGVAGLGGFGVFSYMGKSEQDDLERSCSPECTSKDREKMERWYLIGDISAGVGAASLVGAAIVYLARPTEQPEQSAESVKLDVGNVGSSFQSFGVNASGRF